MRRNAASSASGSASFAFDAALGGRLFGELLEPVRGPVDELVDLLIFFTGGSSPVATRQMLRGRASRRDRRERLERAVEAGPDQFSQHRVQAYREGAAAKRGNVDDTSFCPCAGARPLAKDERQRLIASVVSRRRVGTQHELLDALARAGCRVTQATVSRDIRELGLEKTRDALGRRATSCRSAAGAPTPATRSRACSRPVRPAGRPPPRTSSSSTPSSAPRRRSRGRSTALEHPRIVGTLAGDDTCLVDRANAGRAALHASSPI